MKKIDLSVMSTKGRAMIVYDVLDELIANASIGERDADSRAESHRWRILKDKLTEIRDLAVLKNLLGNGPHTIPRDMGNYE